MTVATARNPFARRVATVFSAKIVVFGFGLITTIFVNRLLGPVGKGAFVAVSSLPALVGTVGVFGLPNAINYFAARGVSVRGLLKASILLVAVISSVMIVVLWFALPFLEGNILSAATEKLGRADGDQLLRIILITIPTGWLASFAGTILYGRHEVKIYTAIMVGQAIATLVVLVTAVGVLKLGVQGAVAGSVVVSLLGALAVLVSVLHVAKRNPDGDPVPVRSMLGYGARVYPASITGYFNYRADVFIIQALMADSAGPLGLYSMAVTMAELIFYIPDAVTTIFLPTVAGTTATDADSKLGRVSRMTVLVTFSCALALIPVAWVGVHLVLPKYNDCIPAFLVLLPGVLSLSLGKIMTSYVNGRGRPGPISVCAAITLILNLVANIILIPQYGIVGAAASSLISYSVMAGLMLVVACRLSHQSPVALVVPRREEFAVLLDVSKRLVARVRAR
jgi:O-antigen/teichoic acid export membrane protein